MTTAATSASPSTATTTASTAGTAGPKPIDDLELWLSGFAQPTVLAELAALVLCGVLAWGLTWLLRRAVGAEEDKSSIAFGRRIVDGVMFPLLLLALGYTARALLLKLMPLAAFKVVIPVLVSLAVIRLGVPGVLKGVDIDTRFFTGNHPPAASLDGCFCAEGDPDDSTSWSEVLAAVGLLEAVGAATRKRPAGRR